MPVRTGVRSCARHLPWLDRKIDFEQHGPPLALERWNLSFSMGFKGLSKGKITALWAHRRSMQKEDRFSLE